MYSEMNVTYSVSNCGKWVLCLWKSTQIFNGVPRTGSSAPWPQRLKASVWYFHAKMMRMQHAKKHLFLKQVPLSIIQRQDINVTRCVSLTDFVLSIDFWGEICEVDGKNVDIRQQMWWEVWYSPKQIIIYLRAECIWNKKSTEELCTSECCICPPVTIRSAGGSLLFDGGF